MIHKLIHMSQRRAKCQCGWSYALPEEIEPGTRLAQDNLLDQYSEHEKAGAAVNG